MAIILLIVVLIGIVVAACAFSTRENYFSIDPVDTGIERSLWGPLYTLPNQDNRYRMMYELPWCVDPLKEGWMCAKSWCAARGSPGAAVGIDCGPEIPYEMDKI